MNRTDAANLEATGVDTQENVAKRRETLENIKRRKINIIEHELGSPVSTGKVHESREPTGVVLRVYEEVDSIPWDPCKDPSPPDTAHNLNACRKLKF